MAKIDGTYSVPNYENITYTHEYTDINDLLLKIEDNVNNTISAEDIRDSVYTLWKKITGLTPSGTSSETLYTNLEPTRVTVGGISIGSTFSNANMKYMWDKLLYPYIAPSITLTGGDVRELYNYTGYKLSLHWAVNKGSESITNITLTYGSHTESINPNTQSGNILVDISPTIGENIYTMSVSDDHDATKYYSTTTLNWASAIYWGKTPTFELPTMDINISAPIWADGASASSGKSITYNKSGIYDGINGNGQYLVFAWPSSYGVVDPIFKINGLFNTAYQKIGSEVPHFNMFSINNGHPAVNYDVWISSTPQYAPITEFRII